MREAIRTFSDRLEGGKPFPFLLAATGGLYRIQGRARFPEGAKPPSQFIGGRMTWQPDAVYGPALEVGAWERSPVGNLIAELRLGHVEAVAVEEVAP